MDSESVCADEQWRYVATLLPDDLEQSARETGALARCRNIPSAEALMRVVLAYAVSDLSMKDVAAWASTLGVAEITGPGLFYRLREAEPWLARVLAQVLQEEVGGAPKGLRLRAADATVITGPASKGTDWRAHVLIDPVTGKLGFVELTDAHGGEGLGRHPVEPGELVLGDRAYATARGIHAVYAVGAQVLVRLNLNTVRLCDQHRHRIALLAEEARVPPVGAVEYEILVPVPPVSHHPGSQIWKLKDALAWIPARAIAGRTREGEVIWILTTVPGQALSALQVLALYRFRWQIELLFKRLKSLLHLDALPSRAGPTAKSWMLARLLAAALAQKLLEPSGALSPWGYQLRENRIHP